MKLISLIIPVYNSEKFLDRCIQSIINQTYKNIEIILVNDGSIDQSLEICQLYKKRDNRIVIINKKNGGVGSARNIGLQKAKGDYIGFIDSDDYIAPEMYEILLKQMCLVNADISECGYYRVDMEYQILERIKFNYEVVKTKELCRKNICRLKIQQIFVVINYTKQMFLKDWNFQNINIVKTIG